MELVELAGSQRMAATASGIDQATISRVCSGRIDVMSMKVDTVRRMKTALKSLRRKSKGPIMEIVGCIFAYVALLLLLLWPIAVLVDKARSDDDGRSEP